MAERVAGMNADCHAGELDYGAVERALRAQGDDFWHAVKEDRPHLCACAAVFISAEQLAQMRAVIAAVEQVVALPAWRAARLGEAAHAGQHARGVFFGYDFHLNGDGAHLIEINTNAGGAFFNVLLLDSQKTTDLPGTAVADSDLEQSFVGMFRDEWRLTRGDEPLRCIAIIDEQPLQQYLHPEFVLAQRMFERAGITALIADPSELELRGDGLYCGERKVDLVYNRLTDFSLAQFAVLDEAFRQGQVVLTPHPDAYALYADKRNLAVLTDAGALRELGTAEAKIAALLAGIPQVRLVDGAEREQWRADRKQWFFKPATGYGGKGSYRGANVTNRVFDEIMQGGYVAQKMAVPGERILCPGGAEPTAFKVDVRCYVYAGRVQLVVARLYQGQATNFRTPGGGFALVRLV